MAVNPKSFTAGDCVIQATQSANGTGVEAGSVGHVKDLPGKAQGLSLTGFQYLCQASILLKVTIAAEGISLTVFARIWIPQRRTAGYAIVESIGIGEDFGQPLGVDVPVYFNRPRDHSQALVLINGCIGVGGHHAERQPT